jgi:[glutamine synthetase] adenylyltransferase / [glutamine synthetase]-adenylyl-L-tyrosine phosphorylase
MLRAILAATGASGAPLLESIATPNQTSHRPTMNDAEFDLALARLFRASRYAERAITRQADSRSWLRANALVPAPELAAQLMAAVSPQTDSASHDRVLRQVRQKLMLAIIFRDINGLAGLDEVMSAISRFADLAVTATCEFHQSALAAEWQVSLPATQAMIVVGMGKLGGHELNVSSDIDLIFIYAEDGEASASRSWHEFHTQVGKRVIRSLDQLDEHGFVFRVDMRLRPFGASGPLVTSLSTLEQYFRTQARPWERYAWLKARALTGSPAQRRQLADLISPFVFRRYHDYAAIDEMRSLHAQIRQDAAKRGKHDDIKVGAGGIREVEFVAQIHQLVRGGRDIELQTPSTRIALNLLAKRGFISPARAGALQEAYHFLRNLEHRLQYLDDQQTQSIPTHPDDQQRLAESAGFAQWQSVAEQLDQHRRIVTSEFEAVFGEHSKTLGNTGVSTANSLETPAPTRVLLSEDVLSGYAEPLWPTILTRITAWEQASRTHALPPRLLERMAELMRRALPLCAALDTTTNTLFRVWDLLDAIDKRETYLALLVEYPHVLARVANIAYRSIWAANLLKRHPALLDEFVHVDAALGPPTTLDWAAQRRLLQAACDDVGADVERQYELLRHTKQLATLRINVADIEGRLSVMSLSDELTALADMLIDVALNLAARTLHGFDCADTTQRWQAPHGFAVIGYGKLGSKELGYASDLDLVFLYDETSGIAAEQYAKLAQRLSSWLNTMTAGGVLYETDLRLRPDGASGLLVSSLTAFAEYQTSRAWTWEHQALTRARWCGGDTRLASAFETIRTTVLQREREPRALRTEIISMRNKMRAEKKDRLNETPPQLDLKNTRGGIVDIEFIVQYLILAHSREHPAFLANLGNFALITRAAALGLIDEELAASVAKAYLAFRERLHVAQNNDERKAWIGVGELQAERHAVASLWQAMFGD